MAPRDTVEVEFGALLEVAQDLNAIVVSLDRLGSANADGGRAALASALLDLFDRWAVFQKLANAREVLDGALLEQAESEEELHAMEQRLGRGPYWPESDGTEGRR